MSEEIEKQILEELRRQNRINKLALIIGAFLVVVLLAMAIVADRVRSRAKPRQSDPSPWTDVTAAYKRYELDKALALAKPLVAQYPNDDSGYSYLAQIYFLKGDLANAEKNYLRACELFPSEEHEKNLAVIRKRRARERADAVGPAPKP